MFFPSFTIHLIHHDAPTFSTRSSSGRGPPQPGIVGLPLLPHLLENRESKKGKPKMIKKIAQNVWKFLLQTAILRILRTNKSQKPFTGSMCTWPEGCHPLQN